MPFRRNLSRTEPPLTAGDFKGWAGEKAALEALRSGDEKAFRTLVAEHGPWMLRLARRKATSEAVAEEIVQESWLAVLQSLDRFEGRSSLRTWIFSIVTHVATAQFNREIRTTPFSSYLSELEGPSVPPERFQPRGAAHPGGWQTPPAPWDESPEQFLATHEAQRAIGAAIELLPPAQREVISLRDVEGWSSGEVCNALGLSETNQRVLLHRARSRVRLELERYFGNEEQS
jgi:RNA polymerase sigma-70 factor (ECF subfamily)